MDNVKGIWNEWSETWARVTSCDISERQIVNSSNAIISSGLSVRHIEEMYAEDGSFWIDESEDDGKLLSKQELDDLCNWKSNPMAALPQWFSILAVKGNNGA